MERHASSTISTEPQHPDTECFLLKPHLKLTSTLQTLIIHKFIHPTTQEHLHTLLTNHTFGILTQSSNEIYRILGLHVLNLVRKDSGYKQHFSKLLAQLEPEDIEDKSILQQYIDIKSQNKKNKNYFSTLIKKINQDVKFDNSLCTIIRHIAFKAYSITHPLSQLPQSPTLLLDPLCNELNIELLFYTVYQTSCKIQYQNYGNKNIRSQKAKVTVLKLEEKGQVQLMVKKEDERGDRKVQFREVVVLYDEQQRKGEEKGVQCPCVQQMQQKRKESVEERILACKKWNIRKREAVIL